MDKFIQMQSHSSEVYFREDRDKTMIIKLPKGLRLQVADNKDLTCPVGTKATVAFDEEIDTRSFSKGVMVQVDGDSMTSILPFDQCEIITDNFKKTFAPK